MIVVDTSVWIDFFRPGSAATTAHLQTLLDQDEVALAAPVRVELIAGAGRQDVAGLKRVLSALPLWGPTRETWGTIESWAEQGAARGQRFGMGDLLVAAIAAENGASIWSSDNDFERMERLGFVVRHLPTVRR